MIKKNAVFKQDFYSHKSDNYIIVPIKSHIIVSNLRVNMLFCTLKKYLLVHV